MKYSFYIYHLGLLFFVIFAFLSFMIGYKEDIPTYKIFMHSFIAFAYWAVFYLISKLKDEKIIVCVIFIYSLLLSIALRYLFIDYTNDPYENTVNCDVYKYEQYVLKNTGKTFLEAMCCLLKAGRLDLDDLGFTSILMVLHNFFRDVDFVRYLLLLLNSCLIACSAHLIFKLSIYLNFDECISKVVMAFYSLFPFWIVSNAVGLKENIFCFIIVAALFNIYRYKEYRLTYNLIGAIFFIIWAYFFRYAVSLMLIITFFFALVVNEENKKKILVIMAILGVVGIVCLNVIIMSFSGISMKLVTDVAADRMSRSGGTGFAGWLVHCSAAFIGPFPNFSRTGQYNIYFASGLINKVVLSVFVNAAMVQVVRNLRWKFYPIFAYLFMGYVMLLASGTSLDIRYHITFFPAYCILLGFGLSYVQLNKIKLYGLCSLGLLIALFYNFR